MARLFNFKGCPKVFTGSFLHKCFALENDFKTSSSNQYSVLCDVTAPLWKGVYCVRLPQLKRKMLLSNIRPKLINLRSGGKNTDDLIMGCNEYFQSSFIIIPVLN